MSDFGTLLIAKKVDNSELTNSEVNNISSELKKIIKKEDLTNALGEPFEHDLLLEDDKKSAVVQMSEHYYGNDFKENEILYKFVRETEKEEVDVIIKKLKIEFSSFEFSFEFTEW